MLVLLNTCSEFYCSYGIRKATSTIGLCWMNTVGFNKYSRLNAIFSSTSPFARKVVCMLLIHLLLLIISIILKKGLPAELFFLSKEQ